MKQHIKSYIDKTAKLIDIEKLNSYVYSFVIESEVIAKNAIMGQFVSIFIEGHTLRRPFSIAEIFEKSIRIIFKVVGQGTKKMSRWQKGKQINIMGPLGTHFSDILTDDKILIVGGGLGLAPLIGLAKKANFVKILAGFKTKKEIILAKDFKKCGNITICTEDGSFGKKGVITDYIEQVIENEKINRIAACGPKGLLIKVSNIAKKIGMFCEISLEEKMACGIGACLCCACLIEKEGIKKTIHICKDGPIINSKTIDFI